MAVETLDVDDVEEAAPKGPSGEVTHVLALAWVAQDPTRLGEVLTLGKEARIFGRGDAGPDDEPAGAARALLRRSRPGLAPDAPGLALEDPFLSRRQLEIAAHPGGASIVNVGKRRLLVDGVPRDRAIIKAGETIEIEGRLLFVCVRRLASIAALRHLGRAQPFAEPDTFGIVGESTVAWSFRDRLAFLAPRVGHVLLTGESGSGKELAAQSLHGQSDRSGKKLVSRNAATIPSGLIDAELFGNVANYPNAGMPERPGLVGEADGSTLFLDEIGELPESLQSHLLRILDDGGEYQRLGDARRRKADLRLVAATNRSVEELKHDLAARLRLRLEVPGLNERRGDIPLIARHLLRRAAAKDREMGERFLEKWDGETGEPRLALALVRALVTHHYRTHVRELDMLLWSSLTSSTGDVAELTEEVQRDLDSARARASSVPDHDPPSSPAALPKRSNEVTKEELRASMEKHDGVKERVWKELGLASRFALRRLLAKHGLGDDET